MKFALEIDLNMKEIIKKWLYRAGFLIILFSSVVSCFNSFNNAVDYEMLEKIEEMEEEELNKITKMFNILCFQCGQVVLRLNQMENNKILLDIEDYIKIEEFDQIFHDMNLCRIIMSKKKKNYGIAINLLMSSTNKIRNISNYDNNIKISVNEGFFNIENIL